MSICINNDNMIYSKCENLLGIKNSHNLNFNTYINDICKKAEQKLG